MHSIARIIAVNILLLSTVFISNAQNPLFIPPTITGPVFDLNVQSGTKNIYPGNATPTYGINGSFLSPTIVVNKGDVVTLNVNNGLPVPTTMHWHGLHVAPINDGGPHQIIPAGTTWSPSFEILNNAGTFWYHPHGEGKTELHVLKGLSGMFLIHDPAELALGLPLTYGVDDFPLIVQSRAFDALNQVAMASHMDTSLMVNGTLDPILDVPAQIIRMRLLNGSSMRTFNFGFSNGMTFQQIATDGGLMAAPNALNRILLAPGERAEILVDLNTMQGQNFDLMSYSSEMALGIFGSPYVGIVGQDTIMGYSENPLNGADFPLLHLNVVAQSTSPVTTIPTSLVPYTPYNPVNADVNRVIVLDTLRALPIDVPNLAEGPFGINESRFDMSVVNIEIPLNSTEIWTLKNNTHIAHPFHIHDILFNVIEKNGDPTPPEELGWKDVVLVMPHDSVKFITKFTDFTDPMVPYMYHCHLLHHEDDGMMGSFLVQDPSQGIDEITDSAIINVYPNPSSSEWNVEIKDYSGEYRAKIISPSGDIILESSGILDHEKNNFTLKNDSLTTGMYILIVQTNNNSLVKKVLKNGN